MAKPKNFDIIPDEDKKKKAAAEFTTHNGASIMPPDPFSPVQMKSNGKEKSGEENLKENASDVKDASDYGKYGLAGAEVAEEVADAKAVGANYDVAYELAKKTAGNKLGVENGTNVFKNSTVDDALGVTKKADGSPSKPGSLGVDLGKAGKALDTVGKAADAVQIVTSSYQMMEAYQNDNVGKVIEHGADAMAASIGTLGPVGAAFSVGYEFGKFVDSETKASTGIYKILDLDDLAANSTEAKVAKQDRQNRQMEIYGERMVIMKAFYLSISKIGEMAEQSAQKVSDNLIKAPKYIHIPRWNKILPSEKPLKSEVGFDMRYKYLMELLPKLKTYEADFWKFHLELLDLVKTTNKFVEGKERAGTEWIDPEGEGPMKQYKKYNSQGNITEEGEVKINKRGKIRGGTNIQYKKYNENGMLYETGSFDFNSKGKKVNYKQGSLIIY